MKQLKTYTAVVKIGNGKINLVTKIRKYHEKILSADKSIAAIGKAQIRAAYKCGQLLEKERGSVRSGQWGKFCKRCGMSEDTAGRYIKLSKSADLRVLIKKYRTLNMAYVAEGITSAPRQRITIKAINGSAGAEPAVEHHNEGEKIGINLKAKVKGGDPTASSPAPEPVPTTPLKSKDPIARASIANLTKAIIAKCGSRPHEELKDLLKWAFDAVPDRILSDWLRGYCNTSEMVDGIERILDDVKDMPEVLQEHIEALEPLKPWMEITSAPQQRTKTKTTNGSSSSTGHGQVLKHHNGDGNDGINLKAKIKGGGNLGDLLAKVSPNARAEIESKLRNTSNGGQGQGEIPKARTRSIRRVQPKRRKIDPLEIDGKEIARLFERARLIDALLRQLNRSAQSKDAAEVAACASSMRPLIEWYERHAPKSDVALAA